ncbi:MAG: SPFH domain-containing protein [Candidatus Melainabacteria bacterium]|jgi:uncharacterized membrane protein YqiK
MNFWVILVIIVIGILLRASIRFIPNNKIGILEKLFSAKGSVETGFIALNGEAGFQPHILRGGWHILVPFQYAVHTMPLVTIPQGKIGYIFARDGQPLQPTQALASNERANNFEDVIDFLSHRGQKGPQRMILREGTYAINLAQFVVITENRIYYLSMDVQDSEIFTRMASIIQERDGFTPLFIQDSNDLIGVITVQDGPALSNEEIIAHAIGDDPANIETFHNSFQDPDKFLKAGGKRGRQLQVLVEGTYYINRLFATVEMISKTHVEVGAVGVVNSFTGEIGIDLSGSEYKHGELVSKGQRGVWSTGLLPGKYAFNTYAGKVIQVPTTNIVLKWISTEAGSHKLDENLCEISMITKDAFELTLPLSVVIHIDYRKAPLVIQRFGDIRRLVEQTLDPMVAAYFKNIGQTLTLIQLLQERGKVQQQALLEMREKFQHYNLELEEVLIGTPASASGDQVERILTQLRSRQIAEEQIETYNKQEKAAVKERELKEAEARAKQQSILTESEVSITIQSNQGKADFARAEQQASQIRILAQAEAAKIKLLAEGESQKVILLAGAEAERAAKVGIAEAIAIEEQVRAYGGPQFQLMQQATQRFADAIETAKIDIVPKILLGGGGSGGNGNMFESLIGVLLSEKLNDMLPEAGNVGSPSAIDPELKNKIRKQVMDSLDGKREENT